MSEDPSAMVTISDEERRLLVERRATCPFIGSAIAQGKLDVRGNAGNPLAAIDDVRRLGNSGGGDLGDLLAFFASGNHALMLGDSGKLDTQVLAGTFSLEGWEEWKKCRLDWVRNTMRILVSAGREYWALSPGQSP
jgi:hypothetical protein